MDLEVMANFCKTFSLPDGSTLTRCQYTFIQRKFWRQTEVEGSNPGLQVIQWLGKSSKLSEK